jgi:hypothetical protein
VHAGKLRLEQGDRIEQIFANCAIVLLWAGLNKIPEIAERLGNFFSRCFSSFAINFDKKKLGWAGLHFGPFFSQTHPVTLGRSSFFPDPTWAFRLG